MAVAPLGSRIRRALSPALSTDPLLMVSPRVSDQVEQLRLALEGALAPSSLEIIDDSAKHAGHAGSREGGHFRVVLVAAAFAGRSQLERHRLVYAAVAPLLGQGVHALSIIARTPEEIV
jgi:BolA family transcriptional regulator, general stress-responsive regulator